MAKKKIKSLANMPQKNNSQKKWRDRLHYFVLYHDEMRSFQIGYVLATLLLSLLYSLGWFIVLVVLHFLLNVTRDKIIGYKLWHGAKKSFSELSLDFAAIWLASVLAVYTHGIPSGMVGGANYWFETVSIRIAGIARNIPRIVLIRYLFRLVSISLPQKNTSQHKFKEYLHGFTHTISRYVAFASLLLLLLAPWYLTLAWSDVATRLQSEFSLDRVRFSPVEEQDTQNITKPEESSNTNNKDEKQGPQVPDMGEWMQTSIWKALNFDLEKQGL